MQQAVFRFVLYFFVVTSLSGCFSTADCGDSGTKEIIRNEISAVFSGFLEAEALADVGVDIEFKNIFTEKELAPKSSYICKVDMAVLYNGHIVNSSPTLMRSYLSDQRSVIVEIAEESKLNVMATLSVVSSYVDARKQEEVAIQSRKNALAHWRMIKVFDEAVIADFESGDQDRLDDLIAEIGPELEVISTPEEVKKWHLDRAAKRKAEEERLARVEEAKKNGVKIYRDYCAACHMRDGSGMRAAGWPALNDPAIYQRVPELIALLLKGRGGMSSFQFLADDKLADVSNFLAVSLGSQNDVIVTEDDVSASR